MKNGNNQYAPMQGTIELRKQISLKVKRDYGREYNPEREITVPQVQHRLFIQHFQL